MSVFISGVSNKQTQRGYKQPIQVLYWSLVWWNLSDNPLSERLDPVIVVKPDSSTYLFSCLTGGPLLTAVVICIEQYLHHVTHRHGFILSAMERIQFPS